MKKKKKKAGDSKRRRLDTPGMVTHRQHSRLFSSTPYFDPFHSIEQKTIGADPLPKEPRDSCCRGKNPSPNLPFLAPGHRIIRFFFLMKFLSTKSNEACKRVAKETENIKSHLIFFFRHSSIGGGAANVERERMAEMKRHTQKKKRKKYPN